PFQDVPAGSWYEKAVNWAAEAGVVKGTSETTFSPDDPITREQLAAILYRYAQSKGEGFTGMWAFPLDFPDAADVSEYAYEAMCWMTMHGIITGMDDGTLAPKDNATRAQIATMFMRFCESLNG
ncbi:MAG: S-layer homology domain-containing protein, partial [Oscillospiraceae bacterium]|nr:S-layer homology domain-containing protein [Oscillospiraceae bacterium]